jgi:hypothetical protein
VANESAAAVRAAAYRDFHQSVELSFSVSSCFSQLSQCRISRLDIFRYRSSTIAMSYLEQE